MAGPAPESTRWRVFQKKNSTTIKITKQEKSVKSQSRAVGKCLFRGGRPGGWNAGWIPNAAPQGTQRLKGGLDWRILVLLWLYWVGHKWRRGWGGLGLFCGTWDHVSTAPDGGHIRRGCPANLLGAEWRLWCGAWTRPGRRHLTEQSIDSISLRAQGLHWSSSRRKHSPSITVKWSLACIPDLSHSFVAGNCTTIHVACIQEVHPVVGGPSTLSMELLICRASWGAEQAFRVVIALVSAVPQVGMSIWKTPVARCTTVWQAQITQVKRTHLLLQRSRLFLQTVAVEGLTLHHRRTGGRQIVRWYHPFRPLSHRATGRHRGALVQGPWASSQAWETEVVAWFTRFSDT